MNLIAILVNKSLNKSIQVVHSVHFVHFNFVTFPDLILRFFKLFAF